MQKIDTNTKCDVSIVVPFHNEQSSVDEIYGRLKAVMNDSNRTYQIIFVDDGSIDNTLSLAKKIQADDDMVIVVELRKNFGQTPALKAGIDTAEGDIIITMDGDLQHCPEKIPEFLKKIDDGYDLVSGWRVSRSDNFWVRRIPSKVANWLLKLICGLPIHDFGTTFKAYRRELLNNIEMFGENHRFIPVLASKVGARVCEVPIENPPRLTGKSHYGLGRVLRVLADIIFLHFFIAYLARPMFLFGFMAFFLITAGAAIPSVMLVMFFAGRMESFQGHQNILLFSVLLMLMGVIFLCFGIIGEILSRIYHHSTEHKIYYIRNIYR
ncbi:glycosyltransferase family 2 protein [Planctomycetota bacterium]